MFHALPKKVPKSSFLPIGIFFTIETIIPITSGHFIVLRCRVIRYLYDIFNITVMILWYRVDITCTISQYIT